MIRCVALLLGVSACDRVFELKDPERGSVVDDTSCSNTQAYVCECDSFSSEDPL